MYDPDDVAILEEAVAGGVRFRVTGDQDLLSPGHMFARSRFQ
ncbi:MAG: hypothetical protein OXI71_03205 [Gemmatimonadota bacterium]|nr:hypothetical protein [Gemmatimonadota bacterium]